MLAQTPISKIEFSFLMCVNRRTPFLREAIESVLIQSHEDFKFYVIANNCDDLLWEELSTFTDSRVVLHRTYIGQLSFNLNFGLNLIRTGYVLRMDADDVCMPDRLKLTIEALDKLQYPDVLGGGAIIIDSEGFELGHSVPLETDQQIRSVIWRKCPFVHPSCALKVTSIIKLGGYLGGFMSEDYDLWMRAARVDGFVFRNIPSPLIKYRLSTGQARGNYLGYSEVAGFMLRETLLVFRWRFVFGTVLAVLKRVFRGRR